MRNSPVFFTLVLLTYALFMSACSSNNSKIAVNPDKCTTNTDCKQGNRCAGGWCEDMYHPRHKIKNY